MSNFKVKKFKVKRVCLVFSKTIHLANHKTLSLACVIFPHNFTLRILNPEYLNSKALAPKLFCLYLSLFLGRETSFIKFPTGSISQNKYDKPFSKHHKSRDCVSLDQHPDICHPIQQKTILIDAHTGEQVISGLLLLHQFVLLQPALKTSAQDNLSKRLTTIVRSVPNFKDLIDSLTLTVFLLSFLSDFFQCFATRNSFVPQKTFGNVWKHSGYHSLQSGTIEIQLLKARDAAKYFMMHGTAPTIRIYLEPE